VTLVDTFDMFDLLDIPRGGIAPEDGDHFDAAAIVIGDSANDAALEEERTEPSLASLPFFVGFDEPEPLDPERVGLIWELVGAQRPRMRLRSPFIALFLHLAVLLLIVGWASTVTEDAPLIPIKLVIEQAPPEPDPQPVEQPPTPTQPERAEAQSQPVQSAPVQSTPAPPAPTPPVHAKLQNPPAKPKPAQPKPAPTPPVHATPQIQQEQLPPPRPAPISRPAEPPPAPAPTPPRPYEPPPAPAPTPPRPYEAPSVPYPGAGASQDGYLAYLVTLTGQHMNLLPKSLVGDRRGETVVGVAVRRDGVIERVSIVRPSAYPDIDQRVAQMVAAVGRFPPVPNVFQGSPVELELDFFYPEALQGH
jgi:TonB family protein